MKDIFVAIDTTDIKQAKNWAKKSSKYLGGIKLGMEFFYTHGYEGVKEIMSNTSPTTKLFLDLKFLDIPNTVAGAIKSIAKIKPDFFTIHSLGGKEMLKSAINARSTHTPNSKILAVTMLTSITNKNLQEMAIKNDVEKQVCVLAELALNSGIDGLVCSPLEIEILRKNFGDDFILMVPGIRPNSTTTKNDDQKRTMAPKNALSKGANYLVIGRPITQSNDIEKTAKTLAGEIALA